mmetsp:Transcript_28150/g.68059  ORF Transcript_28150/g.68059 Transcript_28150/m.68059 type:complete len:197 (+) Transcript_28150:3-593(+)
MKLDDEIRARSKLESEAAQLRSTLASQSDELSKSRVAQQHGDDELKDLRARLAQRESQADAAERNWERQVREVSSDLTRALSDAEDKNKAMREAERSALKLREEKLSVEQHLKEEKRRLDEMKAAVERMQDEVAGLSGQRDRFEEELRQCRSELQVERDRAAEERKRWAGEKSRMEHAMQSRLGDIRDQFNTMLQA